MDKEIIIDGVNVAGCVQLVEEPFYPCGLGGECKGWENCYYKQLKLLEQENAELKAYKDVNEDFKTAWEELKAENERLKKVAFQSQNVAIHINQQADKYLGCLKEIKAIVKNICDGCTSECDCDEDCNYFLITEQLTKAEEE